MGMTYSGPPLFLFLFSMTLYDWSKDVWCWEFADSQCFEPEIIDYGMICKN